VEDPPSNQTEHFLEPQTLGFSQQPFRSSQSLFEAHNINLSTSTIDGEHNHGCKITTMEQFFFNVIKEIIYYY